LRIGPSIACIDEESLSDHLLDRFVVDSLATSLSQLLEKAKTEKVESGKRLDERTWM